MAPPKFSQIQSFSPLTSKGSLTNMTANDVRRQVVDAYKVIFVNLAHIECKFVAPNRKTF
jgi:hypothetical protein